MSACMCVQPAAVHMCEYFLYGRVNVQVSTFGPVVNCVVAVPVVTVCGRFVVVVVVAVAVVAVAVVVAVFVEVVVVVVVDVVVDVDVVDIVATLPYRLLPQGLLPATRSK